MKIWENGVVANKTLTGGLSFQTLETYKDFIGTDEISFGGNNFEIYFEEDDFDNFIDKHIIQVGENITVVCRRFLDSGMTPDEVAGRMDVPVEFIRECMK